ncbi:MAG TPA: hypothetical protein VGK33_08100 [Chloroflexota bacterium]
MPVLIAASALVAASVALPAYARPSDHAVAVDGAVSNPSTYSTAQLAALPQTSATVTLGNHQVTDTGVPLESLVAAANPAYPASLLNTKNELLRVTATVRGTGHQEVTFAVGELDANFGNQPALVALTQNGRPIDDGPQLVVPGDRGPQRVVSNVSQVTIGIASAPATDTAPSPGSPVVVINGSRRVTLTSAFLNGLPKESLAVSFIGPGGTQSHTEVGPSLLEVGLFAGIVPTFNTWIAAVGSDNYAATVTPGEQLVRGRQLQLSLVEDGTSLAQPRLVTDGDVKGGRYVSNVVNLYAGSGPAR